jgi:hypothetical protein
MSFVARRLISTVYLKYFNISLTTFVLPFLMVILLATITLFKPNMKYPVHVDPDDPEADR